jgi:hypothetical protein
MFSLTNAIFWLYSLTVNAKSLTGFDSLLHKRIPPLSGFFVSVIYLPFCFYGWVFWGAERLAGLVSGLSTRSIRPPRVPHGWRFSRNRSNKGA